MQLESIVDNYLDGGYHVPHIHKGLGSVLDIPNTNRDLRSVLPAIQSDHVRRRRVETAWMAGRPPWAY